MDSQTMLAAIEDAQRTLRNADHHAARMAEMVAPRLRSLPIWILRKLKRELANFNSQTGNWKD